MKWILFLIFVVILLAFDLGVFNRKEHTFSFKEALGWSGVWVAISCLFGGFVFWEYGADLGNQWFTAYVLEKSLSVDNLFVMSLVFTFFATPSQLQHRCLFWGIVGAIIFRGIFILLGVGIVSSFHWILYIFGIILIYSAFKMVFSGEDSNEIHENKVVIWFKKHFRVHPDYEHTKFFIKKENKWYASMLFITLIMIETTDIVFAVDSIPAALGVCNNAFILYTSNIMAILGLRALYFVLLSVMDKFWLLKYGIALVLAFIGFKMLVDCWVEISSNTSLFVTLGLLTTSILLSLVIHPKKSIEV